jgi:transcriptional regulator with XRE-family HTH domain
MDDAEIPPVNSRIREVRRALGISQVKYSRLIAFPQGYVSEIETGGKPVNERLIKLVCSTFSVNETWLRYGEGEMFTNPADEKFLNLVNNFRSLPPEYQNFLFKMFDMFLEMRK